MDSLRAQLNAAFQNLNDRLQLYLVSQGLETGIVEHFCQCFSANVRTGKLHRGLTVMYVGTKLGKGPLNGIQWGDLCALGWFVEMLQAHYLILDDIMDESTTRRGEPCWYRQPSIGLMAINDACLLKSSIFYLLKEIFHQHPSYQSLVDLFVEAGLQTELGQLCDLAACKEQDIQKFSMAQYFSLVKHKSSHYSLYLPVSLALEYWQLATPKNNRQTHEFAIALGEYFQVHDDYIDVFGDPVVTGKVGTDIQDNKCTWLINEALRRSNGEQKRRLLEAYGKRDQPQVEAVKTIFSDLGLESAYAEYEIQQRETIERIIASVDESEGLQREVFQGIFALFKKGRLV